jgi:ATP-dependent Clp protease ATP-binding subunit ClpA
LADNGITADRIEAALGTSIALDLGPRPLTLADAEALSTIGIDLDQIRPHLEGIDARPVPSGPAGVRRARRMRFSSDAKRVLAAAVTCAQRSGQRYVGAEHLLVGILTDNRSLAVELLGALDANPKELKIQTLNELKRVS